MKWDTNGESADVEILGSVQVWCEKIPPFTLVPTTVLQKASSVVLGAAVKTIQRIFINQLMQDYEKWATDPEYREERKRKGEQILAESTCDATVALSQTTT
mmetsp:Transcript_26931/g.47654  ORF Transcript_26931/g.47654 Transcript_26931/m.47654 type:complete len:101 (+) Transcript_26931:244-546(+)